MPEIDLPTLHAGQIEVFHHRAHRNAVRCGRRWGKTKLLATLAADAAAKGRKVGIFAPEHKQIAEPYEEILAILSPIKRRASKTEGTIRTTTGGLVDFWVLNDNALAGRGREYDLVLVDEAAHTKNGQMIGTWERAIEPTTLTRPGAVVWIFSTPLGDDPTNFFWACCNDQKLGFREHHAPTSSNPLVPAWKIEEYRQRYHPLNFQQEILADFVDFSGVGIFLPEKLLVDGKPVPMPTACDSVFAMIDTAVKQGTDHDGTAVSYWATSSFANPPLICLDWDIVSIDGAMLENWIPSVFAHAATLAKECRARFGSTGAWIEDAQSGSILLQQCAMRGLPAVACPAAATSAGKDGRALAAANAVHRGEVKFSERAYSKSLPWKGADKNHMWAQVIGFHIGDKDAAKRADDLLDTFTYSVNVALGGPKGLAA